MKALGIVGWSGSGKTTLITRALPCLRAAGLRVSTIKHAHHGFDLDRPGKDSDRHRRAGAEEVMVVSDARWALLRELPRPPLLDEILGRMAPVDLVLVEGFKSEPIPRIEVHRPDLGRPPLWPDEPGIVAVATDRAVLPGCPLPLLPLDQMSQTCNWIQAFVGKATRTA